MSNFLVSSFSLSSAPRSAVFRIQDELRNAQKEVTTGRFADVGLTLGSRTNQTVSLRVERESAIRIQEANTLIEMMLAHDVRPRNWSEVLAHPYMEDVPEHMIQTMLQEKQKPHLLPT